MHKNKFITTEGNLRLMIGMMKKSFSHSEKAPKAQVNFYHSYHYIIHIIDLVARLTHLPPPREHVH